MRKMQSIQFKKAQMSFSGSLNPFFAVKITDIHLTFSGCKNKVELKSPYVLFPLFLSDAFNKKINMGYIIVRRFDGAGTPS